MRKVGLRNEEWLGVVACGSSCGCGGVIAEEEVLYDGRTRHGLRCFGG